GDTTTQDRRAASSVAHAFARRQETPGSRQCTIRCLGRAPLPELQPPGFPAAAIPPQGTRSVLDAPAQSRPLHPAWLDRARIHAVDHSAPVARGYNVRRALAANVATDQRW